MTHWQRRVAPYLFISPFFIGYAVFFLYPVLWALYLSFFQKNGAMSPEQFVGLRNYTQLFSDSLFIKALVNTSYYALASIFLIVPAAIGLALVLNRPVLHFREFFRFLFFTPNLTSGIVVAIVFGLIFEEQYGILNNYFLAPLGLPSVRWLRDPVWIMPAIIITGLWSYTGINALYFLAGLQNIPPEVREAARMDGASSWQMFRFITLPLLRPVLIFVLTFAIIGSYNAFGVPALLVGVEGGPRNAGLFMTMYLYLTGFRLLKLGYAAAIGYALTLIIILLSAIQLKLMGVFRED
jgi:arabinosaccharide transport system permease protein